VILARLQGGLLSVTGLIRVSLPVYISTGPVTTPIELRTRRFLLGGR